MAGIALVLDLRGQRCLVVGGGRVAERRATLLLRAGARVTLVAPAATARIRRLARGRKLRWRARTFRPADLRGARFVVAATSDRSVDRDVARRARRGGAAVNAAGEPGAGTAWVPAVLRRGPLLVAVSTAGQSPLLAAAIRDLLARRIGPEYAGYARLVGAIRRRLRRAVPGAAERERRCRRVLRAPLLPLLRAGRVAAARTAAARAAGLS